MESNHRRCGIAAPVPCTGCVRIRGGTGWIRTSAHPFNKRPLNQLSFGPKYRCVATPAAVAVRRAFAAAAWSGAPRASEVGHDRTARRIGNDRVAHSGAVRDPRCGPPFDVIPATTSLAEISRAPRHDRTSWGGCTSPARSRGRDRHLRADRDAVALRPPLGRAQLVTLIERAVGIEPGGLVWKTSVSTTTRPPARARAALWTLRAGGGNRTHRGRCGTPARHLEPPASVPPSGVEPEPLGFRPSAQTCYARVGYCAARSLAAARSDSFQGACQHPHRHCSSIVRDRPRAQGAPRAVVRPRATRTHRSRSRSSECSSRSHIIGFESASRRLKRRPETSKGRLVFPGGPSAQMMFYITCLENLRGSPPPCPDRAETPYRRGRSRAERGSGRSWSGTATPRRARRHSSRVAGYVLAGATRDFSVWGLDALSSRTAMRTG